MDNKGFIKKFLCLFLSTNIFVICFLYSIAIAQAPKTNSIETNIVNKPKYFLQEVKEGKIYLLDDIAVDDPNKWNIDFKAIVLELIKQTNASVILHLAKSLELTNNVLTNQEKVATKQKSQKQKSQKQKSQKQKSQKQKSQKQTSQKKILQIRKMLLDNFKNANNTSLTSRQILESNLLGAKDGVLLQSADVFEYYNNEFESISEKHLILHGNVIIVFSGYTVEAKKVTLNADKRIILFDGDVKIKQDSIQMETEKYIVDIDAKSGFAFDIKGKQFNNFYRGKLLKINSKNHITVEKATLTFTSNKEPHYYFSAEQYNRFGNNTTQIDHASFFVHNHPFFYFPFFIQADYDFGVNFSFGNTKHEGYYILFDIATKLGVLGDVVLSFNTYEKLGTYIRLQQKQNLIWSDYTIDLAYARYLVNNNITLNPLTYTFHNTDRLDQEVRNRFRINYSHKLNLVKKNNNLFRNTMQWKIQEISDPFFSSDFEKNLPSFDVFDFLLNANSIEERIYQRNESNVRLYSFGYSLATQQINFQLEGKWTYANRENRKIVDENSFERWETTLSRVVAPSTSISYSDVLDAKPPKESDRNRFLYLNLAYNVALRYRSEELYKTIKPYSFDRHLNNVNLLTSLSRGFHLNEQAKSNPVISTRFNSQFSFGYQKQWGGEVRGDSYVNNNYRNTFFNLGFNQSILFYLPSFKVRNTWVNSYDIRAMLPVWQLNAAYRISLKSESDRAGELNLDFDIYAAQQVTLTSTINWNWYSVFFIPYLDIKHQLRTSTAYDLIPKRDTAGIYEPINYNLERIFYFNNILTSKGNLGKMIIFDNNFKMRFFDPFNKKLVYELKDNVFKFRFIFYNVDIKNYIFNQFRVLVDYNWKYFFLQENYLSDFMNAKLVFTLKFLRYWDATFTLISENNSAYRYFPDKSSKIGVQHVNFFSDLYNSSGLTGFEAQKQGLFKFKGLDVSMYHDLDSWYAKFSYSFYPVLLPNQTGSVKGFYLDQRISFEVNIKLDSVDSEVGKLRGFLPNIKRNFRPPIFDDL